MRRRVPTMSPHGSTCIVRPIEARTIGILALAAAVAAVRVYQCAELPQETGDVVRNLLHGVAVDTHGIASAAQPLKTLAPAWADVAWARFPYNYPPLALAFFALVSAISPTVFFAKLALTAIEAVNAYLVRRLSGSALLGVFYWSSPLSIWWVSREGQFEPLQSVFMLLALLAAGSMPFAAGLSVALGISVKATAAALAPLIFWKASRGGRRALAACTIGFIAGLLPLAISQWAYGGISNIARYSSLLAVNPYYWNPFAPMFEGNPIWRIVANELASYGLLAILLALAWRSRQWLAYLAPIAFLVFCKTHGNVLPWYFVLMPAFLMTVPDPRWRFALVALCPLLDVASVHSLVHGASGPSRFHGLPSAFAPYDLR